MGSHSTWPPGSGLFHLACCVEASHRRCSTQPGFTSPSDRGPSSGCVHPVVLARPSADGRSGVYAFYLLRMLLPRTLCGRPSGILLGGNSFAKLASKVAAPVHRPTSNVRILGLGSENPFYDSTGSVVVCHPTGHRLGGLDADQLGFVIIHSPLSHTSWYKTSQCLEVRRVWALKSRGIVSACKVFPRPRRHSYCLFYRSRPSGCVVVSL